jgi:hypothetical protein
MWLFRLYWPKASSRTFKANEDVLEVQTPTAFEILAIEAEGEKVGIAGCLS